MAQSGQAVLEYVLLISFAVAISVVMFNTFAGPESKTRKAWLDILCKIGADNPDSGKAPVPRNCP